VRRLRVALRGEPIGTLFESNGRYGLTFDEAYREAVRAPILSLSFLSPDRKPVAPAKTLVRMLPFFANLLPEPHSGLRSYLARENDVPIDDDLGFLRALGVDLPGAVTLEDADDTWKHASDASMLQSAQQERPLRFSLAGIQMKFSVVRTSHGYAVPPAGIGGTHILKLPEPGKPGLPENEAAIMTFAAQCGIPTPPVELVNLNSIEALPERFRSLEGLGYVIKRFDRKDGERLHMEDFAQILRVYPEDKYERKSYDELLGLCRQLLGETGVVDFIRRLVFAIATANADMHLKNWSVLYTKPDTPALAPAYDYVCTAAYSGYDDFLALPLAKARHWNAVRRETFTSAARQARVPATVVLRAVNEMCERIKDSLPSARERMPEQVAGIIERQLSLPLFTEA
jgi:serine/threonine-protein kinase HipA